MSISIVVTPPGPKAQKIIERDHKALSSCVTRVSPLVAAEARGVVVKDVDGNTYIDMTSGIGVTNTGHCHPKVVQAIKQQVEKLIHLPGTDFYTEKQVELAEKLFKLTPGNFEKRVFFTNSGTESIECAMKTLRWHTTKPLFLGFIGAFHGRSLGALSLTCSKRVQRERFSPLLPVVHAPYPYCYRCPFKLELPECDYWCVDYIEEILFQSVCPPGDLAGVVIEPIQGEAGYIVPPPKYFQRLTQLLQKYGLHIVVDEIQTGFGRTGRMFASEHWGLTPDIITLAKALAAGVPMGACVARKELMDWGPGAHGTTYGGSVVAAAAAIANLEVIQEENLVENARIVGEHILAILREEGLDLPIVGDVRGKGLMIGVELVKDKKTKAYATKERDAVIGKAFRRGVLLLPAGSSTIRLAPPLVITEEEAETGVNILLEVIRDVCG